MTQPAADRTSESIARAKAHLAARVPQAITETLRPLCTAGAPTWLFGPCVHEMIRGRDPNGFQAWTLLPADQVLTRVPRAVPTAPVNRRLMLPTKAGALDLFIGETGDNLLKILERSTFRIDAMAYDPVAHVLLDAFEGNVDARAGQLRSLAEPRQRFARRPLEAFRAARLIARFGDKAHPALLEALGRAKPGIAKLRRVQLRPHLFSLLELPSPGRAISMLHETGIEESFFSGALSDCGAVIDRLPAQRPLRLAAWLRETDAQKFLQQLGTPGETRRQVQQLLRHHPIERRPDVRRLSQIGETERGALFALRRAELATQGEDTETAHTLDRLEEDLRREASRPELALNGSQVMEALACPPGRRVGEALRFLHQYTLENPDQNNENELLARLHDWNQETCE